MGEKGEKKKRRRKRRRIADVAVAVALSWPLPLRLLLALCLALPRSQAESTEDNTSDARGSTFVISQDSRPRQNALANRRRWNRSKASRREQSGGTKVFTKNTLRQTVLFVAARSTSTAPASSKHRGKSTPRRAKATPPCNLECMENNAATASQRCFFPPAGGRKTKQRRSPPFPSRHALAYHKVRVQDAKLDRLDALDRRRRVREAVHRRHDGKQKEEVRLPSTLLLLRWRFFSSSALAMSNATESALACAACVRRGTRFTQRKKRTQEV